MNQEIYNKGKDVLRALNSNGCEAFFVGETVRYFVSDLDCPIIHIETSAPIDLIKQIFLDHFKGEAVLGGAVLDIDGVPFLLENFKMDPRGKTPQIADHYSKAVSMSMAACDFTIDALTMSHSGNVTDFFGGLSDIDKRRIKTILPAKQSFKYEPIRILKALALYSREGYKLPLELRNAMRDKRKCLLNVNHVKLDYVIKDILEGRRAFKTLKIMDRMGLFRYIPVFGKALKKLRNNYKRMPYQDFLALAFIINEEIDKDLLNNVGNIEILKKVFNVALTNPKCKFDTLTLYSTGRDAIISVYNVNSCLGRCHTKLKQILQKYDLLPIKKTCDLAFKGEDLLRECGEIPADKIMMILDDAISHILDGTLNNTYEEVKAFCQKEIGNNIEELREEVPVINVKEETEGDDKDERIRILEEKLAEQAKSIEVLLQNDKENRMNSDVDKAVSKSLDELKNKALIDSADTVLEEKMRQLIVDHLKDKEQNDEN